MTNSFWTNLIHTRLTLFLQKAFVADTYKPHKVKKKKKPQPLGTLRQMLVNPRPMYS